MVHRGVAVRVVLPFAVLLLTLVGCGGESSKDLPKLSDKPTAEKTVSGLDRIPTTPPKRPKDVRSEAGAIAFSEYLFEVVPYVNASHKVDELNGIADRKLCRSCDFIRDAVKENGPARHILDGKVKVTDAKVGFQEGGFYGVNLKADWPGGEAIDEKTGKVVATIRDADPDNMTVNLQWRTDKWVLLDYSFKDKGKK